MAKHVLSDIEPDGSCWCSLCGPSTWVPQSSKHATAQCITNQREKSNRSVRANQKRKHGLTLDEAKAYCDFIGSCEICGSSVKLVVDHCHLTKKIRGVLCHRCNVGIGMLSDSVDILQAAITYLQQGVNK